MKLWTSISEKNEEDRWKLLSQHLNKAGTPNEYRTWPGNLENLGNLSELQKFHHVRFSDRTSAKILPAIKVQSSWTTLLGVADGMVRRDDGWWPLCALYESLNQTLIELGDQTDKHGSVLVAGAGGAATIAIASLFKSGFQKFAVTNLNEEEAHKMMHEIRRRFFGLEISWIPLQNIVTLSAETSVLVNCTQDLTQNQLILELSYLNFLMRTGWVIDLAYGNKKSVLLTEAGEAGVGAVSGNTIAARSDLCWAKWAFGTELDFNRYAEDLAGNKF